VQTATTGIELRGLRWAAGGAYELGTDSFRIGAGAIGVIATGPSAGEALADVVIGLRSPLQGTVSVDGSPLTGQPAGQRPIALVPCGGGLLPHLTVERNIGFGLAGRVPRQARLRRVSEVLAKLQLESLRRLGPHEISGVQRLRVAVARAMCAPVEPVAVVIEDRRGQFPCRAAVMTAVAQDLAVLVITDAPELGAAISATAQASCRAVGATPGGHCVACRPAGV
jgi:ABC-type thiamine transport system ATPase subunit